MSQITTEHSGHEIVYSENEDVWRCWNLDAEAKTLSALKVKINKHLNEARRLDNVRVWKLDWGGTPELYSVTLLEGDGAAWVSKVAPGTSKGRREKVREKALLKDLVLDTAENRAAIEMWRSLESAARTAQQKATDAKAAIARVTVGDLRTAATKVVDPA